jgi:hypothetical protein
MRTAAFSSFAGWIGAASILLWLSPCAAFAELVSLTWVRPAGPAPVSEFLIYKGTEPDWGVLVDAVSPEPDAWGVYSADVQLDEIDEDIPVYVWITATNDIGEGPPSNANLYPIPPVLIPEPRAILQLVAGGVGLAFLNKQRMRKNRRPSRTGQSSS